MSTSRSRQLYLGRQISLAISTIGLLLLGGTLAFKMVGGEEWSLFDAFYMTVITVTTVGYQEIHPLGPAGRLVTVLILFGGVGTVLYYSGSIAEAIIEGRLFWRRRVARAMKRLKDHFIVCGYGRVGQAIARELASQSIPHVVIDLQEQDSELAHPHLAGDATDDAVLEQAGIRRARGLVSVLGSDAENIYTVLAARALCPDLFIIARCGEERSESKLAAAGADRVINPYERGGLIMAQIMLRPQVVDFLEEVSRDAGLDVHIEEIPVRDGSKLHGTCLRESPIRRDLDIIVTAILKGSGEKRFNPLPDDPIEQGDVLIAMGRTENLDQLARLANPNGAQARGH